MAVNFQKVFLYEKSKIGGVTAIRPVGGSATTNGGWDHQRNMRLNADNVTLITSLGVDIINDNDVFNVKVNGAKDFITDLDGIDLFDNWVEINLYTRTLQPEGSDFEGKYKYQYFGTGASARVVPQSVATVVSLQVTGVDEAGEEGIDPAECFRVTMIDGTRFVTDREGYNDVKAYANPLD